MFYNTNVFITLILGVILFYAGRWIFKSIKNAASRVLLSVFFVFLGIPGLLAVLYYLHIFGEPLWYVQFRSINNVEIFNSLVGLIFGYALFGDKKAGKINLRIFNKYMFLLSLILIIIPFIKPVIFPVGNKVEFKDNWKDGVCIQSSGSTCGPAALATVFKYYRILKTEKEIAREAYSCSRGTENWYLIRFARKAGMDVECRKVRDISDVRAPAVVGTFLGNIGHFITVLGKQGDKYIIGDSLTGKVILSKQEFNQRYKFSEFVMEVRTSESK